MISFYSVLPSSFSPNKSGYKKYLNQGGGLDFASFKVYERRSSSQILKEESDKLYNAVMHHYDMAIFYRNSGEIDMYELHMKSADIRAKQHTEMLKDFK